MERAVAQPNRAASSEGIFYLIALFREWAIMPVRFDQQSEFGHTDFWEQSVVDHLVTQWHSKVINTFPAPAELRAALLPLVYAFPRGRVVRQGDQFTVYHGNNLKPFMKMSRRFIEGDFGIQGRATWVFDEHEQCVAADRDRMREVLGLKQTWPAAAVSW